MKKYNEDFTTITSEVYDKICAATEELGCKPIMVNRASNHPEDDCLWVVLAQYIKPHSFCGKAYCVWTANVSERRSQADLFYGHYDLSFTTALKVVADKTRDLNKEEDN
jgi:hypothetical protein